MNIPPDLKPVDPAVRKRTTEAGERIPTKPPVPGGQAPRMDQASFGDAEAIQRYVSVLKTMNPASLHRVEELRARIADGSYTADPEELADMILGGNGDAERPSQSQSQTRKPG
jgi:anti-sigma28 factor (negative regulator of flagellin synthesis)